MKRGLIFCLLFLFFLNACEKRDFVELAVMETGVAENILAQSAQLNGTVVDIGPGIEDHGICWSEQPTPTANGEKKSLGAARTVGGFTLAAENLKPGTKYYYTAYAKSGATFSYGTILNFTTLSGMVEISTSDVSEPSASSVMCGGQILNDGGSPITARGLCWNTTGNPEAGKDATVTDINKGIGSFTLKVENLEQDKTYFIRAYATNGIKTWYGANKSFSLMKPAVTTLAASNLTSTGATLNGTVNPNGLTCTISFEYGLSASYGNTAAAVPATASGNTVVNVSAVLPGLQPGKKYYFAIKAVSAVGTSVGQAMTFTISAIKPTVTTNAATDITPTSAKSGGNVTSDGGAPVTVRGVCWSTAQNPTTANNKTTDGSGTGSYPSNITGLTPGTTYYVRAYATNSAGTEYGNQISFKADLSAPSVTTSVVSSITSTGAVSGGNVTSDGGAAVTIRGVCWSTSQNPTTANSKTTDGSGTGSYPSAITGLTPATTYYVRAYATNSVGTQYGNQVSFTTSANLPSITTSSITDITSTGAKSGGNITSDGGAPVTARGVCWSTSQNPTTANSKTTDGSGTGSYPSAITGLSPGTTYYVRAYATNSAGTQYGNQVSFKTSVLIPVVITAGISDITSSGAKSGGSITSDGGAAVTARGVCWSTSPYPETNDSKTNDGTGTGNFTSILTGLLPGTTYYVRAYATNTGGTGYGEQVSFVSAIKDIDNNTYQVVQIGNQLWMAEELRTTKFNDGTPIQFVVDTADWMVQAVGAYSWYLNNSAYKVPYGGLYNWYAVDSKKLCPAGWHVPTDPEWAILVNYLGTGPGGKMKTTGTIQSGNGIWNSPNTGATNSSGFSAVPGGNRRDFDGGFDGRGDYGSWWSSTSAGADIAWHRFIMYNNSSVGRSSRGYKVGFSVRCLKDN
jgi:uncharacterized protein (TIGR02145 family)